MISQACPSSSRKRRPPSDASDPSIQARLVVVSILAVVKTKERLDSLNVFHSVLRESASRADASLVAASFIEEGALAALVITLNNILQSEDPIKDEAETILQIVDLILRGCPQHLRDRVMIDLNVDFFDLTSAFLVDRRDFRQSCHLLMLSILHMCSGSSIGTMEILMSRKSLFRVIDIMESRDSADEILYDALGLTKNLAFFADEHRDILLNFPRFLQTLSIITLTTFSKKILERISATFRNLAISSDCRITLVQTSEVLQSFVRMAGLPNRTVRRNILNTVINLATDQESCVLLLLHGDGALLDAIKRILRSCSEDDLIRQRATRLLRQMSNETSAPVLSRDHDIICLLKNLALHDRNQEVRSHSAEAFVRCAGFVQADNPQYNEFLDALVTLAEQGIVSNDVIVRTLREQTSLYGNCRLIVDREFLVASIIRAASTPDASSSAKDDACCVLHRLATDEYSQHLLMRSPILLTTLVTNAIDADVRGHNSTSSRRLHAIQSLVGLASIQSNRKAMVNSDRLLHLLIHFASTSDDTELKGKVKQAILWLVQEV
jgi:hypothetical protein